MSKLAFIFVRTKSKLNIFFTKLKFFFEWSTRKTFISRTTTGRIRRVSWCRVVVIILLGPPLLGLISILSNHYYRIFHSSNRINLLKDIFQIISCSFENITRHIFHLSRLEFSFFLQSCSIFDPSCQSFAFALTNPSSLNPFYFVLSSNFHFVSQVYNPFEDTATLHFHDKIKPSHYFYTFYLPPLPFEFELNQLQELPLLFFMFSPYHFF